MASVWYIGLADVRRLTISEWAAAGIVSDSTDVWSSDNGWSIPEAEFTAPQLAFLDTLTSEFVTGRPDTERPWGRQVASGPRYALLDNEGKVLASQIPSEAGGAITVDDLPGSIPLTKTIDDAAGAGRLAMTTAERTKLSGVASNATANASDTFLRDRANHTGSQTSSSIADFAEAAQDAVAAMLAAGTNVTMSYNDAGNGFTINASGAGGLDAEAVRDAMGVAMIGVGVITVTVNDAADTIAISTTATANDTDANLKNRANHTGLLPIAGAAANSVFAGSGTSRGTSRSDVTWLFTGSDPGSAALDGLDFWLEA